MTVHSTVTKTVLIQNAGNADLYVSSLGLCTGTSSEYSWSLNIPCTIAPGSTSALLVTYAPVDESMDQGCLMIASNDPVTPTIDLHVTGSGSAPLPQMIDIDISSFSVTSSVRLFKRTPVVATLTVTNPGKLSSGTGSITATLVGVQNKTTVYNRSIALDNIAAGASAKFSFPSYLPTVVGTIDWTVMVNDTDPDVDRATATTKVSK